MIFKIMANKYKVKFNSLILVMNFKIVFVYKVDICLSLLFNPINSQMLATHQKITAIENASVRKTLRNRKAMQMAVLSVHDNQKKFQQQQKKNIKDQFIHFNRNKKHLFLRKILVSKINVLETVTSSKRIEANKHVGIHVLGKSQSPKMNQIYHDYDHISKQKSYRNNRAQSLVQKMSHKLQKVHIRANINLVLKNRQITQAQRILAKRNTTKHKSLHQSLSCRQILVQKKNSNNIKTQNSLKNNLFRAKITNRSTWRQKDLFKSLQSKNQESLSAQNYLCGWQSNQRYEQLIDFEDDKNQSLLV